MQIQVTPDPVSVATALGLTGAGLAWPMTGQNIDPRDTVFRIRSATKPVPADVRGFRHGPGEFWTMHVHADEPTWLWTRAGDDAIVVAELGIAGV